MIKNKFVCASLSAFFLTACGSAPTLTEPSGNYVDVNTGVRVTPTKSIETSKPKVVENKIPESIALTNKAKPTDLVSLKNNNNNSSLAKGNKSTIQSQTLISPTKTNKLLTKNTITSMKVTPNPKPVQTWQIEKGITLKDGVMAWAIKGSCVAPGVKNWTILWQTPVNYQIDAPLKFSGDFKSALRSVLELYHSAKKPLYAETNTPQCVVIVKDGRF